MRQDNELSTFLEWVWGQGKPKRWIGQGPCLGLNPVGVTGQIQGTVKEQTPLVVAVAAV